jgi:uncharacterized protein DUF4349
MRPLVATIVVLGSLSVGCELNRSAPSQPAERELDSTAPAYARSDAAAVSVMNDEAPASGATAGLQLPGATDVLPNLVIRSGTASIQVDSLDRAIALVRALAQRVGGFVAGSVTQAGQGQLHSASLELRMPAERFDDAVDGLRSFGKVESVNISAQDVGEEYVDVNARMVNARRLEARLIELLARRTGKLGDVLDVEHELARVREEIERYEGRLRYLRSRAAVSTLTLNVHEQIPVVDQGTRGIIAESLRQAWRNLVALIAFVIQSLGVIAPLALVGSGAWLVARRFRRPPPKPAAA